MTLDVVNADNQKVGTVDLGDALTAGPVKQDLIWESVVRQNASERSGTHSAKNRALVSGSCMVEVIPVTRACSRADCSWARWGSAKNDWHISTVNGVPATRS